MNWWKRLIQFIRETRTELQEKTTWPTRDHVLNTTVVVLVSLVVVSIGLFIVDLLVSRIVKIITVTHIDSVRGFFSPTAFFIFVALVIVVPIAVSSLRRRFDR
jgi:preprotein translocase subunit SecE